MTNSKYQYNRNVFYCLEDGKVIACNTLSQEYYELEEEYFKRLLTASNNNSHLLPNDNFKKELLEGGLLLEDKSEPSISWEGDPISFFCHQGTRILSQYTPKLRDEEVCGDFISLSSSSAKEIPARYIPEYSERILLQEPNLDYFNDPSLYKVTKNRKTCRNFDNKSVEVDLLASLLYFCFGPIHGKVWEDFEQYNIPSYGLRRSSPSATGLQGCDAYLVALNVEGLEKGIYYYSSDEHCLYRLKNILDDEGLIYATNDQFWAKNLSAGIFIVNDMRRTWVKDKKARGYLAAYLEAGHVSQTILLAATSLKLQTWLTGTFRDDVVDNLLQLKGSPCFASVFVGMGYGDNGSIPKKFIETIRQQHL